VDHQHRILAAEPGVAERAARTFLGSARQHHLKPDLTCRQGFVHRLRDEYGLSSQAAGLPISNRADELMGEVTELMASAAA
jgi:hypothetical protein